MTAENPLPQPGPSTGGSVVLRTEGSEESQPITLGLGGATTERKRTSSVTSQNELYALENELRAALNDVYRESRVSTTSANYKKAKAKYDAALQKFNNARSKKRLRPITSVEELEETDITSETDITVLQNELQTANALGDTKRAKEVEQKIAEAQAVRSSSRMTPAGVVGVSQQGLAGYIPDLKKSTPILNSDMTLNIVDANNQPLVINNKPLTSVYLTFQDKNFYERGVKTTIQSVTYRSDEEIRNLAFSLGKNDRKKLQEEFKKLKLLPSNYNANGQLDRDGAFENAFLQAHAYANRVNFQRLQNQEPILGLSDAIKEYGDEEGLTGPQVSRSISEFALSEGQAEGLLEEFYTKALGVRPSKKDVQQFKEIVQRRAGKKPRVTETTTTEDGGTSVSRTKVIDTGFGAAEAELLARRQAEARPEFAPYQMATTFYDALLRAAQSPVRLQDTGL